MNNYFEKFPNISYSNNLVTNIISKIQFNKTILQDSQLFHPYTLKEGERADILAQDYYGDSRYAWLIFLANKVVDPYYNWPLTDEQFKSFIVKKYGSVEKALNKVAFYRVEYESDDRVLSIPLYDQLPARLKKYWSPIFGDQIIIGYERKKSDEARETNKTIYLDVDDTSIFSAEDVVTTNVQFTQLSLDTSINVVQEETIQQGDAVGTVFFNFSPDTQPKLVLVKTTNGQFTSNSTNVVANSFGNCSILNTSNTTLISEATVKNITGNTLIVQHVGGKFTSDYGYLSFEESFGSGELLTENQESITLESATSKLYVKGTNNSAYIMNVMNDVIDSNGTLINVTIDDLEFIYWTPVSCFTYETELNDAKRFIYLLDKSYLNNVEKQISELI